MLATKVLVHLWNATIYSLYEILLLLLSHAMEFESMIYSDRATRQYTTLRKDFYFRIKVSQVEPWVDHEDNGFGKDNTSLVFELAANFNS